jgi:hypothetical protein
MNWQYDEAEKTWYTKDKIYEIRELKHTIELVFYGKLYSCYESVDKAKSDAINHRDRVINQLRDL